jgi:ectoine hydroxylase-related dioxygenase (phytanoyl-CoA dioxygenase family)
MLDILKSVWSSDQNLDFKRDISLVPKMRRAIHEHGCIVVRQLVAPQRIDEYAAIAAKSFAECERVLSILKIDENESGEDVKDERLKAFVRNVRMGQIEASYYSLLNDGKPINDILVGDPDQNAFVEALLGSPWYMGASIIRKVTPVLTNHQKNAQKPIIMHCDGPHLSRHTWALNFWLTTVDVPSQSPGLQLVPGPFEPMQQESHHDWEAASVDMNAVNNMQNFYSAGSDGKKRFIPQLKRGDAVIFHNWIMHGSYALPDSTKPRISFEMRFNAPKREMFESFAA